MCTPPTSSRCRCKCRCRCSSSKPSRRKSISTPTPAPSTAALGMGSPTWALWWATRALRTHLSQHRRQQQQQRRQQPPPPQLQHALITAVLGAPPPCVDPHRVDLDVDLDVDRKLGRSSSRKRRAENEEGATPTPTPKMDDGESEDSSSNKRHRCSNKSTGGPKLGGGGRPNKCTKENNQSHSHSHSPPTSSRSTKDSSKQSKSGVVDPTQDYVHVRARRGQATDSHSLAERVRREKISERMKFLQDLVPGCNKTIGKAMMLDEIINYVQSLQHQIEFLSMKLAALNPKIEFDIESLLGGIGEMLPNVATTNTMEATNNVEQLGSMCDMVFNPSTNMSFQMLLQTPLPPDDSTLFPKSLPGMLNVGNVQSTSIPQLPSAWDSRGMPLRRDDLLYYASAPTEPRAGGNHHPSMPKVEF